MRKRSFTILSWAFYLMRDPWVRANHERYTFPVSVTYASLEDLIEREC